MAEAVFVKSLLDQPHPYRHPSHGHAFQRSSLNYPSPCSVCQQTVLLFGNPCKCLVCGILAHRTCVSRTYFSSSLPLCSNFQPMSIKKGDDVSTLTNQVKVIKNDSLNNSSSLVLSENEEDGDSILDGEGGNFIDDDDGGGGGRTCGGGGGGISTTITDAALEDCDETELDDANQERRTSITDPDYRKKQVQRGASLGGSTFLGTVVGGVIGGVGVIASPPLLGALCGTLLGKAAFAVTGATFGYRRQRLKQLELHIDIPTEEKIPDFWSERATYLRNHSAMKMISTSYSSADEEIQLQVDDCNVEEKVNLFVSKVLLNNRTLPGMLLEKLTIDFKSRHSQMKTTTIDKVSSTSPSDRTGIEVGEKVMRTSLLEFESDESGSESTSPPLLNQHPAVDSDERDVKTTTLQSTTVGGGEGGRGREAAAAQVEEDNNESQLDEIPSPVLDCMGLLLEVAKVVFYYHPLLGQDDKIVKLTMNAVERVVLGDIYSIVFTFLVSEHDVKDRQLINHRHEEKKNTSHDDESKKMIHLPLRSSDSIRQSPSWGNLQISEEALRSLAFISKAKTGLEKLMCVTRFVKCVSDIIVPLKPHDLSHSTPNGCGGGGGGGGGGMTADDLLPLLAKHVAVAKVPFIHAELAFITLFCRDEALLIGADGYALTSLCAAVGALDKISDSPT